MIIIIINTITLILLFPAFSYVILRHVTRRKTVEATYNRSSIRYQSSGKGDVGDGDKNYKSDNNNNNKSNNNNNDDIKKNDNNNNPYLNHKTKNSLSVIYGNKWEHWNQQQKNNNNKQKNNNKHQKQNNQQLPRVHSSPSDYTSASSSVSFSFNRNNNKNNSNINNKNNDANSNNNSDSGFSDATKEERWEKKTKVLYRKSVKQVNNNNNNNNNNNTNNNTYYNTSTNNINNKCHCIFQRLFDYYCQLLFKPFVKVSFYYQHYYYCISYCCYVVPLLCLCT